MAYRLSEVPVNNPVGFLMEFVKLLLKFTYKSKGPERSQHTGRETCLTRGQTL